MWKRNLFTLILVLAVTVWGARPYNRPGLPQRAGKTTAPLGAPVEHVIWDGNNISTTHGNHGDIVSYHITSESGLEWPKGSGKYAIFQSGPWLASGKSRSPGGDWEEELRTAAAEYTVEFSPGALPDVSDESGKIYQIHRKEIEAFLENDWATFSSMTLELPISVIEGASIHTELVEKSLPTDDFLNWPWQEGAPWVDANGDGVYNPQDGDYPDIIGDLFHWYVMNDGNAATHTPLWGTPPMNVEIQTSLFGFDQAGPLGDILFVRWVIINKGIDDLDSVFVSFWHDDDVGDASDDLVGCDVDLSLGYTYNDANGDQSYGEAVPAVGTDFFQGPLVDSPGDTAQILTWSQDYGYYLRKVPDKRQLPLTSFVKYINSDPNLVDPNTAEEAYRYMNGLIGRSGEPFIDPTTGEATKFVHPGDPTTNTGWIDNTPGDRRYLMSSGPFMLTAGDTQEVVGSIIIAAGENWAKSINKLKFYDLHAQQAFDANFEVCSPVAPEVDVAMLNNKVVLSWEDNSEKVENYTCAGFNFEGYNVYQGASVNGPWTKVATFDEINGYQILFSGVQDEITGGVIKLPVQEGSDSGIEHYIEIDYDYINNRRLINNRMYYYTVTSYIYDPNPSSTFAVLESPFKPLRVVPGNLGVGTTFENTYTDTLQVTHSSGSAQNASFFPYIVNPYLLTGHTYTISFVAINDSVNYWALVDSVTNDTLVFQENFPVTEEYYQSLTQGGAVVPKGVEKWVGVTDGFLLTSEGTTYDPPTNISKWEVLQDDDPSTEVIIQGILTMALTDSADNGSWWSFVKDLPVPEDRKPSGSPSQEDMQKDIEFRFTDNGSIATYINNPAVSGSSPPDTIWIPFEMWLVDPLLPSDQQVNVAVYQVAGSKPIMERDTLSDNGYLFTKNLVFMPVYEAYDEAGVAASPYDPATDGHKIGWMIQFDIGNTVFESGNIVHVTFPNPLVPGEDMYTFKAVGLAAAEEKALITEQIKRINVFPNPYFGQNPEERNPQERFVYFTNLGVGTTTIRIFTLAGDMVAKIEKTIESENDADRRVPWDLRNTFGIPVASGMYIAHVSVEDNNGGQLGEKLLKLAIFQPEERLDVY